MDKVKVVLIPNPYKHDSRKFFDEEPGQKISECIIDENLDDYLIYLNGIQTKQYKYILKNSDFLIIIPNKGYNLKIEIEDKDTTNIPTNNNGFTVEIANEQLAVFWYDQNHYIATHNKKELIASLKPIFKVKTFEFVMLGKIQYALEGIYNFEDGLRCMRNEDIYRLYKEFLVLNGNNTSSDYKELELSFIKDNINEVESLFFYFKYLDISKQQNAINNTMSLVIQNVEKDLCIIIKMLEKEYPSLFEIYDKEKNDTINILIDIQYELKNICSYTEKDTKTFKDLALDIFSLDTVYNNRLISLYHILYYATMYYFQNLVLIENKDRLKKTLKLLNDNLNKSDLLSNELLSNLEKQKLKLDEISVIQNGSLQKKQLEFFYVDYFRQTYKNKDKKIRALLKRLGLISPSHYHKAINIVNKTKIMFPESKLLSPKILY